jgi:alpha-tubulin suppressor-like RCC1 family protein
VVVIFQVAIKSSLDGLFSHRGSEPMSRNLFSFGLQLLWLIAACGSGGLDSHRFQVPSKLSFTTPPKAGIAVGRIRPDVVVTVLDENNKPVTRPRPGEFIVDAGVATPDGGVPEASIQVTLALGINPGGGTLLGTVTAVTVNGVATFSNLFLDKPGTGYTLVAEAAGLKATSDPFKVTFPPAKLVFQVPPGPTTPVEAMTPSVEVAVLDVQGSLVEAASMSVRLDLQPPDVPVAGNSAEVTNGVAIFRNLVISKPGRGYTLTAWAPGMSTTSDPFNVEGFVAISAGSYTCGIDLAGATYCWGGDFPPTPVAMAGGLSFAAVTVGDQVGCGLTAAGAAYCWGDAFSSTPVAIVGGLPFAAVSGNCGVLTTGAAYCWGDNNSGQLGNGSTSSSSAPVAVAGGLTFASVSAGASHNCGVTTTGAAYCWGSNYLGELGNGSPTDSSTPVAVAGGLTFVSVSAGPVHSCGVTTAGAAYCWGMNNSGQLGNGESWDGEDYDIFSSTPVAVAGGLTFASVSAGGEHSCGVTTAGEAYCWGRNDNGELGTGSTSRLQSTPVAVAGGLTFATMSTGGLDPWGGGLSRYSCGVTTAGVAYCWGSNGHGELGNGSTTSSSTPVAVAGGLTFSSVSTGAGHNCGLTTAGEAYCWGDNYFGELGNGSTTNSTRPVAVAGGLTFASVSADAFRSSCGVTTAGEAYCWGFSRSTTPVAVAGEITFASLSAGANHSCGVTSAGVAYCWGFNDSGELGDGSTTNSETPVVVAGGLRFGTVSAGTGHTCGVTAAGAAYCWGRNVHGELGNGSMMNSSTPVAVVGAPRLNDAGIAGPGPGLTFASVSAGALHTCGVTTAGLAYCWGDNQYGALGDALATGSVEPRSTPVAVAGGHIFATVSAEAVPRGSSPDGLLQHHTCGVTTTGAAYCWGSNFFGELGNGSTNWISFPGAVGGDLTFASVSAGGEHSCGLTTAGGAYCWGGNYRGELGIGSDTSATFWPTRVSIP